MGEKVAITPEFRLRLIDLEYKDLPDEQMIKEIYKIYIEEYGKELKIDIDIFHSSQSSILKDGITGYNGTAIHFFSDELEINEVYIISQGTQDITDWEYNVKAMFAGIDYSQAQDTQKFTEEAIGKFDIKGNEDFPVVIGLSHSLAHNNNTTAHLAYNTFDKIYSVNGAQTNYYQLFRADFNFQEEVRQNFSIPRTDPNAIYNIDPQQLRTFAENYYADKAKNIHQLISEDDPLYAVSGVRGFFTLGEVDYYDTNPDFPGLRTLMDDIPDPVIKDFQELAVQYTVSSQRGGMQAAIQDILGVDLKVFDGVDSIGSALNVYMTKPTEINTMVRNLNDQLPGLMSQVKSVTSNSEVIFNRFKEAGYISNDQKQEIVAVIQAIEQELQGIQETVASMVVVRDTGNFLGQLGGDVAAYFKITNHIESLQSNLEILNKDEYKEILHTIGASHGITEMLQVLDLGNKSYLGTDMVLATNSGGKEIQVNLSASLRMYREGKQILEEKLTEIERLRMAVEMELFDCYEDEKQKLINKINDMEQNPGMYRNLLRKHIYFPRLNKIVRRISVHEVFYPLRNADFDVEITSLIESVEVGHLYIENYRKAIEQLFDEDERIAARFNLIGGI
ncbi:DUF6792 domain-containing protein [Oceanobacillus longus]|uniref:DUF6792 domain-containing protein n=1 Tax=Oceanobacillus longus TaxID=930120 RepID=A0ABV8GZK1_9BACI